MSLLTWKAEFYPRDAADVPKEEAVAHSLQKWIGLRAENLKKHNCERYCNWIREILTPSYADDLNNIFYVDSGSCVLCLHYLKDQSESPRWCEQCPLARVRGGFSCSVRMPPETGELRDPWLAWTKYEDPEPMIMWLEKTVQYEKEKL